MRTRFNRRIPTPCVITPHFYVHDDLNSRCSAASNSAIDIKKISGPKLACHFCLKPQNTLIMICCACCSTRALILFAPELVRNQDDELNLRLTRVGGKIWQSPKIKSWYTPRSSFNSLFRQYHQYGYWKVKVIQKHKLPASLRHLIPGLFVFGVVILGAFAVLWPLAFWLWLVLLGLYGILTLGASIVIAAREGVGLLPLLPMTFSCYHVGYGWGFLKGVLDFVVLRKQASTEYTVLSRTSADDCSDPCDK